MSKQPLEDLKTYLTNPSHLLSWKENKIRLEQTVCKDSSIYEALTETLRSINNASLVNQWKPAHCFISYAWPHEQHPEEIWIQLFLQDLSQHLNMAGIQTLLDRKHNRVGGSVYGFIEQLEKSEYVLVAGSRSLLLKHKIGKSNICSELNKIREKPRENIFPILLSGNHKISFPEWFEGYTNIVDWRDESYILNLKEMLRALYKLSLDNKEFNEIWNKFERNHVELVQGLPEQAVRILIEEEANKVKYEFEKSYVYFLNKLNDPNQHDNLNPEQLDEHLISSQAILNNKGKKKTLMHKSISFQLTSPLLMNIKNKFLYHFLLLSSLMFLTLIVCKLNTTEGESSSLMRTWQNISDVLQHNESSLENSPLPHLIENKGIIPEIVNPIIRVELERIETLSKQFTSGPVYVAITGFSGTGKTVLAQSYVNRLIKALPPDTPHIVWFIRAREEYSRLEDYKNLARSLNIKFNADSPLNDIIRKINQQLIKYPDFIMVFDNVVRFEDIEQLFPSDLNMKGHVVVTSQCNDILPIEKKLNGVFISLNEGMSKNDAINLLQKLTDKPDLEIATSLSQRLGNLPLALVQAGNYISKTKMNYSDYLALYNQSSPEILMNEDMPITYKATFNKSIHNIDSNKTYSTVLKFSINDLSPEAQELLNLCAYLASENIEVELFDSLALTKEQVGTALNELARHSLITFDLKGTYFSIHKVIQDTTKAIIREKRLIKNQEELCIDKGLELLHNFHRKSVETEHDFYNKRFLIPHFEAVLSSHEESHYSKAKIQAIIDLALLYKAIGHAKLAGESYNKVRERLIDSEDILTAELYKGLGRTHQSSGDFEQAKKYYERSYEIYAKLPQTPTKDMAEILNDLGMIYRDIGHEFQENHKAGSKVYLEKSLVYLKKAVELVKLDPTQRKNQVRYFNNLGEIYRKLRDLDQAEKSINQALKIGKIVFINEKHRLIASSYFNLGNVQMDRKQYQQASLCFEKAVQISSMEEVSGKNHPILARHMDALGQSFKVLGQTKQACDLFKDAYNILDLNKNGQKQLKQLIQEHVDSCDPNKILNEISSSIQPKIIN